MTLPDPAYFNATSTGAFRLNFTTSLCCTGVISGRLSFRADRRSALILFARRLPHRDAVAARGELVRPEPVTGLADAPCGVHDPYLLGAERSCDPFDLAFDALCFRSTVVARHVAPSIQARQRLPRLATVATNRR